MNVKTPWYLGPKIMVKSIRKTHNFLLNAMNLRCNFSKVSKQTMNARKLIFLSPLFSLKQIHLWVSTIRILLIYRIYRLGSFRSPFCTQYCYNCAQDYAAKGFGMVSIKFSRIRQVKKRKKHALSSQNFIAFLNPVMEKLLSHCASYRKWEWFMRAGVPEEKAQFLLKIYYRMLSSFFLPTNRFSLNRMLF